ncbi:kinase-like domain-containing protein [Rhizophagus clarus]|uniref:Kinase-like domain-containing protein n=1 Tax=Rhizophagus clarus TaxID=94130 RepID=A0A8H3LED5_9GLOM|nr:kinase-like domain-containing protein [Rhizophagus clarus]
MGVVEHVAINIEYKWCKPCRINELEKICIKSGNQKIDNIIQTMQLEIGDYCDQIFEWIPYNQFVNIKEIRRDDFIKSYSIKGYSGKTVKIYGISQDPNTKNYIMVLEDGYCENCGDQYIVLSDKWCRSCQINNLKEKFGNWTSENEKIDNFIQEMQLSINRYGDIVFEWVPYDQFDKINDIESSDFGNLHLALWMDGPLHYNRVRKKYIRINDKRVTLKCLHDSRNSIDEFLNEAKSYSIKYFDNILTIYGISQNPNTKDYILVLQDGYCEKCEIGTGGFATVYSAKWRDSNIMIALKYLHNSQNITNEFLNEAKSYSIKECSDNILPIYGISQNPDTRNYIIVLKYIGGGNLGEHIKKVYHWPGKLQLLVSIINGLKIIHKNQKVHRDLHIGNILCNGGYSACISDMGLCGEVDNIDKTKIYGVMPYVAPEVLRGCIYTHAADIYSFGMIMYFMTTKRQPFANYSHDQYLALSICNGFRPEINEQEVPKCYNELMKKCWDPNPKNRPNAVESEEYRRANPKNIQLTIHPEAYYTSRLLNPYTKDLLKWDNNSTLIDFTKSSNDYSAEQ